MIDIKTLSVGDACPCAAGMRIWFLDIAGDQFCCTNAIGNIGIKHTPIPGGGYTNLTNVAVTPRPIAAGTLISTTIYDDSSTAYSFHGTARPNIDRAKYPHVCPTCHGAVYIGFTAIEHAATGNARCP